MSLKTSYTIQAIDKVSAPVRKIGAGITSMAGRAVAGLKRLGQSSQSTGRAVATIESAGRRAAAGVRAIVEQARRVPAALRSLENNRGLKVLKASAEAGGKALGHAAKKAAELSKWAGAALGAGIVAVGFGVLKAGIEYENFMAVLEGTERSAAGAAKAMLFIQDFAKKTPYALNEVTQAFVSLRSLGLDASERALTAYGDLAASRVGKSINDVIEAVADARTSEWERLKEFGIKAKVVGSQVEFAYATASGQARVKVKNDAAAIETALISAFETMAGGNMARRAKGLGGILSNLGDLWGRFLLQIGGGGKIGGDDGVFGYIKKRVEGLLVALDTPEGGKKAAALAKSISDGLIKAIQTLENAAKDFDFGKFIADLATLVAFGAKVVTALGGIGGVINTVVVAAIANVGYVIGSILVGIGAFFGVAAAPIIGVVAAVTAVIAGLFLLWRNWSSIKAWFVASWNDLTISVKAQAAKWVDAFTGMWSRAKTAFETGAAAVWNAMPAWLQGVIKGAVFVLKLTTPAVGAAAGAVVNATEKAAAATRPGAARGAPAATNRASVGRGQAAAPAQVGGRIDVHVSADGRPSVRKISSANPAVPIDVYRGSVA